MEIKSDKYTPHFMHTVLQQYTRGVRGYGFAALAKKNSIKGGRQLVSYWYKKWDGTESSLSKQSGGDKRSILTPKEKKSTLVTMWKKEAKLKRQHILKSKRMLKGKQRRFHLLEQCRD
jgi:hypothetical protein